jgi:hypothetical protein
MSSTGNNKSVRVKLDLEPEHVQPAELGPALEGPSGQQLGEADAQATFAVVASYLDLLHAGRRLDPIGREALHQWSAKVGVKFKHASFLPAVAEALGIPPPT